MHRVGGKPLCDGLRTNELGRNAERHPLGGEAPRRVLGREQAAYAPGGIFQRSFDRVPAVEHHRPIRRWPRGWRARGSVAPRFWLPASLARHERGFT